MTPPDITQRAHQAVADVFIERPWDPATITPETDLVADLDFDSMEIVMLGLALESEFEGLTVRDADSESWKTFGDVLAFLGEAVGAEA